MYNYNQWNEKKFSYLKKQHTASHIYKNGKIHYDKPSELSDVNYTIRSLLPPWLAQGFPLFW